MKQDHDSPAPGSNPEKEIQFHITRLESDVASDEAKLLAARAIVELLPEISSDTTYDILKRIEPIYMERSGWGISHNNPRTEIDGVLASSLVVYGQHCEPLHDTIDYILFEEASSPIGIAVLQKLNERVAGRGRNILTDRSLEALLISFLGSEEIRFRNLCLQHFSICCSYIENPNEDFPTRYISLLKRDPALIFQLKSILAENDVIDDSIPSVICRGYAMALITSLSGEAEHTMSVEGKERSMARDAQLLNMFFDIGQEEVEVDLRKVHLVATELPDRVREPIDFIQEKFDEGVQLVCCGTTFFSEAHFLKWMENNIDHLIGGSSATHIAFTLYSGYQDHFLSWIGSPYKPAGYQLYAKSNEAHEDDIERALHSFASSASERAEIMLIEGTTAYQGELAADSYAKPLYELFQTEPNARVLLISLDDRVLKRSINDYSFSIPHVLQSSHLNIRTHTTVCNILSEQGFPLDYYAFNVLREAASQASLRRNFVLPLESTTLGILPYTTEHLDLSSASLCDSVLAIVSPDDGNNRKKSQPTIPGSELDEPLLSSGKLEANNA